VAEADPVTGLAGLIKQRRRWLNGTFFAMIYTLSNWNRIWTESHHRYCSRVRILCLPLNMLLCTRSKGQLHTLTRCLLAQPGNPS
jgi:cellulose synthase/poly-beta-1,6-N-acetylglucosamine synthase-like glycosyltransferase